MPVEDSHSGAPIADSGPVTGPFRCGSGMKAGHDLAESVPLAPLPIAMAAGGCFCAKEGRHGVRFSTRRLHTVLQVQRRRRKRSPAKLATPPFNVGNTTAMRYMADQGFTGAFFCWHDVHDAQSRRPQRPHDGWPANLNPSRPGAGETKTLTWVSDTAARCRGLHLWDDQFARLPICRSHGA